MGYDEFFTDGDKPYAENLNDSLALLDAFDVTVPCSMPDMFNNGDFTSTVNVTRKCGVALVTLKSVDSGVTIGTDEISGTGDVVFRVYPNFNSFYKWSKIIIGKTGTVGISFKKIDGTAISATVGSDGTISETAALKELAEIDVVLTLTNATISSILIWFINNQTSGRIRTGALLEAEQLVNVNGTVVADDLRAVNGDTVKNAFDSFETNVVDEKLEDLADSKADVSHTHSKQDITNLYNYSISASEYNVNIDSSVTITVKVTDQLNRPVGGVGVPVLKNNVAWVSGVTGDDGTFSETYTANDWGLITFSANTANTQLNVQGWKTKLNDTNYTVRYNDEFVEVSVHIATSAFPGSWSEWQDILSGSAELRPKMPVVFYDTTGKIQARLSDSSYKIAFHSASNTQISQSFYGMVTYSRR